MAASGSSNAYALAEVAYYKVAAVAKRSSARHAPAATKKIASVSRTHIGVDPHEFIDSLGPHSPRSKP